MNSPALPIDRAISVLGAIPSKSVSVGMPSIRGINISPSAAYEYMPILLKNRNKCDRIAFLVFISLSESIRILGATSYGLKI